MLKTTIGPEGPAKHQTKWSDVTQYPGFEVQWFERTYKDCVSGCIENALSWLQVQAVSIWGRIMWSVT